MTDMEGSTRLWSSYPDLMNGVMARHHEIAHAVIREHGGWRPLDQGEGDAVFAAFDSATDALAAAVELQRRLAEEEWPGGIVVKDRIGVHAGEVTLRDGNLFGSAVNRTARIRGLGAGGQVLLSAAVLELVRDRLPDGVTLTDLGRHRVKDFDRPERIHQADWAGSTTRFPPLAGPDPATSNLPVQSSSFVGRDAEVREAAGIVRGSRLVTFTGFGGIGKTRLAIEVAAEVGDGFEDGVWFVDCSALHRSADLASAVSFTLGIQAESGGGPTGLHAWLASRRLLLVLDNLEQLLPGVALEVEQLLSAGPGVTILATSREPLRLRAEQVYPVGPLRLPERPRTEPEAGDGDLRALAASAAVSLLLARAAAVRPGFTLTPANADAVAAICIRLDGVPLALELAAARLRALSPEALLRRLDRALTVLTDGSRDLPARQRTLRASIAWSYDSLEPAERRLLDRLSVFPGTFTLEAAERIAGPATGPDEEDLDVLDGLTRLVDRSLVRLAPAEGGGEDRYSLLVPIRDYLSERSAPDGPADTIAARHADHYRRLVALPPDADAAEIQRQYERVLDDWHNIRAALQRFRDRSQHDAETQVVADVAAALMLGGASGEAMAIVDAALQHLPSPVETTDQLRLLLLKAGAETDLQSEARRALAQRFLVDARQIHEPSLLAEALTYAAEAAGSRDESRSLLGEARALLDALPERGNAWPRWLVQWDWDTIALQAGVIEPAEAEATLRARFEGRGRAGGAIDLALFLLTQGRLQEAAELLRPFERSATKPAAEPALGVYGAHLAAAVRIELSEPAAAERDLLLLEQQLSTVDMPAMGVLAEVLRAAIDRLAGRHGEAVRRLESALVHRSDESTDSADIYAEWLLAVLLREGGDEAAAARLIRSAWAKAPKDFLSDTVRLLLLEQAAALLEARPSDAARLLGLAEARREGALLVLLHRGVDYDVTAMLDSARAALGPTAAEEAFAAGRASALPDVLPGT